MNRWHEFERRWLDDLLESMLPGHALGPVSGRGEFWTELEAKAPTMLSIGLRAASWFVGSWIGWLEPSTRDRVLERMYASRSYLVRQLIFAIKLVACFAQFSEAPREPTRARSKS